MSEFVLCCPSMVGNCVGSERYEKVSGDKMQKCLNSVNTWDFLVSNLAENYSVSTADKTRAWPATRVGLTSWIL